MKKLLIGVGVLGVVLGVVLWRIYANLDIIVAKLIEDVGSEVTQTPVRVTGVNLDLKNGRAGVMKLSVGNPAGFSSPDVFSLELVSVAIDVKSVGSSPLVIDEIVVRNTRAAYEIDQQGTSNLSVLKKNVESYSAAHKRETAPAQEGKEAAARGEETRLIIRKLSFEGGEFTALSALRPDEPVKAALPAFSMRDLGQSSGGATGSQIAKEVLNRLVRQTADAASKAGVDRLTAELRDKASEKLGDKAGGVLKGLLDE